MPSYNKKDFKESNVNYLNKDFTQLKESLINYSKSYFPNTYRDFNETSPGMMLMEMSAYVGDVLSFYVDQQYREMLLPLAEERRNVVNMAKMFGYKIKPICPAYVDLTFKSEVSSVTGNESQVDYSSAASSQASSFPAGITVTSNNNADLIFETLDVIDFTITGSDDGKVIATTNADTGLASTYTLERKVKAISGKEKTKTFTISSPTKFLKLTLEDKNVIDIISCVDSNGNNWYEVDFLAQEYVPIETHYTQDTRTNAYTDVLPGEGGATTISNDVSIPYSLQYLRTSKRFTRETNPDNTTSLIFGNGISRDGRSLDDHDFKDLEQSGIVIPGTTTDLSDSIDPLLGDDYSTLGETPIQTVLTVTYRVGGGINSNSAVGDLTQLGAVSAIAGTGTGTISSVTNEFPAIGGRDEETVDEIREKAKAFFTTQNRCVTKEDYEARVLNIPSKFGSIAKVYVSRFDNNTLTVYNLSDVVSDLGTLKSNIDGDINDIDSILNASTVGEVQQGTGLYSTITCTNPADGDVPPGCPNDATWQVECTGPGSSFSGQFEAQTQCAEENSEFPEGFVNQFVPVLIQGEEIMETVTDSYTFTPAQFESLQLELNSLSSRTTAGGAAINIQDIASSIPDDNESFANFGTINVFVLAYNSSKQLVGNALAGTNHLPTATDNIPNLLLHNVKNYLENFKILTDDVEIQDGYIINFGVLFDVVAHKFANKNEVKLLCIEKIKDYFSTDKMQFSQPIYVSQLEYELMGIDGVRAVNYVTITQYEDHNFDTSGGDTGPTLNNPTYTYSILADGTVLTAGEEYQGETVHGTAEYGYRYDFKASLEEGVILPPHPTNPGVFELKNPNQNIKGVVR